MTFLVERLAELRRHLDHLYEVRPRVDSTRQLETDLSLHNDVLFSLLTVSQLVIDISGEISSQEGLPFDDYTSAVRNLARIPGFEESLVETLARLPGFRNVIMHEYVELDFDLVLEALNGLEPIEEFVKRVGRRLSEEGPHGP
jgi:uncharacterized protein YutE (UPF0331/DUF86 family)